MNKTRIIVMTILLAFAVVFSAQNAMAVDKSRTALSPYFQSDAGSTYSFMGIAHPSLLSAASTVGLTVSTVGQAGVVGSTAFTIAAGETYRVFIVSTNHSTINSKAITGAKVLFLSLTTSSTSGSVLFTASKTEPATKSAAAGGVSDGFQGLNQLAIWGAVVIPGTSSGFAMEFIGDSHDSNAVNLVFDGGSGQISVPIASGRGID